MERGIIKYVLVFLSLFLSFNATQGNNISDASGGDYVTFKVVIEREDIGVVGSICFDEIVFVNLIELMDILGFPYQWESKTKKFKVCCPTPKNCLTIQQDSLIRQDSISIFPDSVILYDEDALYVRSSSISTLLGIECSVIFQSLKIKIEKRDDFPVLVLRDQEIRRKRMMNGRENILFHKVDTLPLSLSRLSSLGYALSANSSKEGLVDSYNTVVSANGEFLKGALHLNYNHTGGELSSVPDQFTLKHSYTLRYKWLKQLSFFRDYSNLTLDLDGYASGVYLSNDNTTFFNMRYYLYKGRTRPNTEVEIYNNSTLVSFISSDSLGNYEVIIPVNSGVNNISAVTFNAYGESISDDKTIYMPQNMEPHKKFRYAFSAGYADSRKSFSGVSFAYGLTPYITVTALAEAMYAHGNIVSLAGVGFKFALSPGFQGGVDYLPGVKYAANLTGNVKRFLGYNVSYEEYKSNQTIIASAPLRSFKMDLTTEIPFFRLSNNLTFSLRQNNYKSSNSFSSNIRWNMFLRDLSASIYATSSSQKSFTIDNINLGTRLGYRITNRIYNELNYSCFYSRNDHRVRNRVQYQLAKKLMGNLSVEYQSMHKNFIAELGVTFRFPWMTIGSNMRMNNAEWTLNNSISGGMNFYKNKTIDFSNQSLSGSSLHVALFVDKNGNGKYEKDEEIIEGGKVIVKTGAEISYKKSGAYFRNIAPENAFKLVIPRQVFKDISWQITPIEMAIYLAPYQSRSLFFPVKVISEIAGYVFVLDKGKQEFLQNIPIEITHTRNGNTIKLITDEWGSYSYLGLTAGEYEISIESDQLIVVGENKIHITIPEANEGEQLEGLDFEVRIRDDVK